MAKKQRAGPAEQPELWERLPNESPAQYEKFCAYRDMRYLGANGEKPKPGDLRRPDMTIRRSIRGLADAMKMSRKALEPLSVRFSWVERAEAYDEYILQRIQEKHEADILKMHETHATIAAQMLKKATARLLTLPETEISPSDIARLVDIGVKIERLSRGEATENQQISGDINTHHQESIDLSRLTDEDLRRLAAIGGEPDGSPNI